MRRVLSLSNIREFHFNIFYVILAVDFIRYYLLIRVYFKREQSRYFCKNDIET